MSDGRVKLWHWQKTGLPLNRGTVDHAKSEYACRFPDYVPSIQKLVRRLDLPDDQFIWCSDSPRPWHGNDRIPYELSVPEKDQKEKKGILAWLNPSAWVVLIGSGYTCSRKVCDRLKQQAGLQGDVNILKRKRQKRYESLSPEDLWAQLFRHECAGDERDVIVSFPLNDDWILHPR